MERTPEAHRRTAAVLTALSLVWGCGDRGEGPGEGTAPGPARPLREVALVLTLDGGPAGGFGRIGSLSVGPGGRIHVLDRQTSRVSVWSTSGDLLRAYGGKGAGPGEFRAPLRVRALDGGGAVVGEMLPARLHRFDARGRPGGSWTVEPGRGAGVVGGLAEWRIDPAGQVRLRLALLSLTPADSTPNVVLALDSAGAVVDTLLRWRQAGSAFRPPPVLSPRFVWQVSGEELWTSPGSPYVVRRHGPGGQVVDSIRRRIPAVRVDRDLASRAREAFVRNLSAAGAPAGMVRNLRSRIRVAAELPAITGLWISRPGGEVWVGRPQPTSGGEELLRVGSYDVYSPDGRLRVRVASPSPRFRLHEVRSGLLYGVWKDALDVEHVRVYRLEEAAARPPAGTPSPQPRARVM